MQLTFTLNLRRYPSDNQLHDELRDLGFSDGGFIPPRFGFRRWSGQMYYPRLLAEASRLDDLCPDWVPFILDLEAAFRWARQPQHPVCPPNWTAEQSYDLIRETYNFMRQHFPHRYLTDWARNAKYSFPITDKLGGNLTCQNPITNRKVAMDDGQWLAIRKQEYDECLTWRMPVYLWMSDWNWQSGNQTSRPLTDEQWQLMIDFAVERQPDWIIYSGAGSPDMIKANAEKLARAVARQPEF